MMKKKTLRITGFSVAGRIHEKGKTWLFLLENC